MVPEGQNLPYLTELRRTKSKLNSVISIIIFLFIFIIIALVVYFFVLRNYNNPFNLNDDENS